MIYFFLIALFCISSLSAEKDQLNKNNDHGLWLDQNMTVSLPSFWTLNFQAQQRWGDDYQLLYNLQYEGILHYDLSEAFLCKSLNEFSWGAGYNYTEDFQKNTQNMRRWVGIHKPVLESISEFTIKKWKVNQRFRWEYHAFNKKDYINHALYRYRLIFFSPWKITCKNINPYVYNEWFFRKNSYGTSNPNGLVGGWFHNRVRVGVVADVIADRLTTNFYWQWRILKQPPGSHPRWNNTYQVGWKLNWYF